MNYIKHLNVVLRMFHRDYRLNPSHISLYMALFREWNLSRFSKQFGISRKVLMDTAKINSNTTYHRCIRELDEWKYIHYFPSHNPHTGSVVQMPNLFTGSVPNNELNSSEIDGQVEHYRSTGVPVTIYKQENMITEGRPLNEQEVLKYFSLMKQPSIQGIKFFAYYQKRNWKISGGGEIRDWKALAQNWFSRADPRDHPNKKFETYCFKDYLKNTKDKDYDEPL